MLIFDTYAWIEFFIGTGKGKIVAQHVFSGEEIGVSSLCLAELQVKYERENRPAESRLQFIRSRSVIIDVNEEIALLAASTRLKHGLYLIDAVMYATALHFNAKLLTGDRHFAKLENVEFLK